MKKTGVFLGFQPGVNLSSEGIGRLLAFILKENSKNSEAIVLFCPKWLTNSLEQLLGDNKIPLDSFEIVSTRNVPLGVKVKNYLINTHLNQKKTSKIKKIINKSKSYVFELLKKGVTDFFNTTSKWLLILKAFLILLISILLIPFFVVVGVLFACIELINILAKLIRRVTPYDRVSNLCRTLIDKGKGSIYQIVIDTELNRIVNLINKKNEVKVCFIPSMIWPQIRNLKCKKVVAAPDIVFYDFPTQFLGVGEIHERIRESIAVADHLICYSEHVKNHQLIHKCGVNPNKITVIKHANIDMNEHIKISKTLQKHFSVKQNAKLIISRYLAATVTSGHVLYNVDIEDIDYVIYSSQYRPHKNMFNLIKAIKILNNEMQENIKLIVTGDFRSDKIIEDYVRSNHLENDIFVMYNISSELLAAFNSFAKLAVNPTLFEGGFPFTFSEAYSVGTPSVMSDIPVVNYEINDNSLRELMLFDPYNPYSIAEQIKSATKDPELLYLAQDKLYQQFSRRSWELVASEYSQVFNKLM
ncbi:Glycosyl transferases group 1 [compost metagenome]